MMNMKYSKRRRDHDPLLSKEYKKYIGNNPYTSLTVSSIAIKDHYMKKHPDTPHSFKTKDGYRLKTRDSILQIVAFYTDYMIEHGMDNPDGVDIMHLGKIIVKESNSVTGLPRVYKKEDGTYGTKVDTPFDKSVKYRYTFIPRYAFLRGELRQIIHGAYNPPAASKILAKAYSLHPKGKFYIESKKHGNN